MLGYWWSDQATVTLDKVSVRYSNATGTVKKSDTKKKEEAQTAVKNEGAAAVSSEEVNQMSSSEIVADMKVAETAEITKTAPKLSPKASKDPANSS